MMIILEKFFELYELHILHFLIQNGMVYLIKQNLFVRSLLQNGPRKRPTDPQALQNTWWTSSLTSKRASMNDDSKLPRRSIFVLVQKQRKESTGVLRYYKVTGYKSGLTGETTCKSSIWDMPMKFIIWIHAFRLVLTCWKSFRLVAVQI